MTITAAAAAIAAVLSTLLTAFAIQAHWTASTKRIVSTVVDGLIAIAVLVATNSLGVDLPKDWVDATARAIVAVGIVAFGAEAVFQRFRGAFTAIENATTWTPKNTDTAAQDPSVVITSEQPADTASEDVAEDTSGTPPDDPSDVAASDISVG